MQPAMSLSNLTYPSEMQFTNTVATPGTFESGYDAMSKFNTDINAAEDRAKKQTLSAKLEAAFGSLKSKNAIAAQTTIDELKKKLAIEKAKIVQNPALIADLQKKIQEMLATGTDAPGSQRQPPSPEIQNLQNQLDAEMAKPMPNESVAADLQAQIDELTPITSELEPGANMFAALAQTNPELAFREYADILQKRETDANKAKSDSAEFTRATQEAYAGIGAYQSYGSLKTALDNMARITGLGNAATAADIKSYKMSESVVNAIKAKLMSDFPNHGPDIDRLGYDKNARKELESSMTESEAGVIAKEIIAVKTKAEAVGSKLAASTDLNTANKYIEEYQALQTEFDTKLASIPSGSKNKFLGDVKLKPVGEYVNNIRDAKIRMDANAASQALANAQFDMSNKKFANENEKYNYERVFKQLDTSKLMTPSKYESIWADAHNPKVALAAKVKELAQLIEPGLSVNDAEFANYLAGNSPGASVNNWLQKAGIIGEVRGDDLVAQIEELVKSRYEQSMNTIRETYGNNLQSFDPAAKGYLPRGSTDLSLPRPAANAANREKLKLNPAAGVGVSDTKYKVGQKNKAGQVWTGKAWR